MSHEALLISELKGNIPFTSLGFGLGIKSIRSHCLDFCIRIML